MIGLPHREQVSSVRQFCFHSRSCLILVTLILYLILVTLILVTLILCGVALWGVFRRILFNIINFRCKYQSGLCAVGKATLFLFALQVMPGIDFREDYLC